MSQLEIENLSLSIANTNVCNKLDLKLEAGQIWGLLGRNGVGKTTLLHTFTQLRSDYIGTIKLDKKNLVELTRKKIAQKMGILLQSVDDPFPSTVLETVLIGRHPYASTWQWLDSEDNQRALEALKRVKMQDFAQRSINQLSGGERQRVALATLLTQDPEIFLLDEPSSHLDLHYQISLLDDLCEYAKKNNRIVLMSLHDINLAARFCDHFIFLMGDGVVKTGSTEELLKIDLLNQLYQHPIQKVSSETDAFYVAK